MEQRGPRPKPKPQRPLGRDIVDVTGAARAQLGAQLGAKDGLVPGGRALHHEAQPGGIGGQRGRRVDQRPLPRR